MNGEEVPAPAGDVSFLSEASVRDREVARVWRPRFTANPADVNCADCSTNYIYQWIPCTIDSIRVGKWAHDDGYNCLPICDEHHAIRVAQDKKDWRKYWDGRHKASGAQKVRQRRQ